MRLFRSWMDGNAPSAGRRRLLAAACACCAAYTLKISPAQAAAPEVQRHLQAARAAAGDDLQQYLKLAEVAQPTGKKGPSIEELMALPPPPPGKAFDNLYFVGGKWVSAWAVTTSAGIILIDAMNNTEDVKDVIEPGMRKLGLDPAQIKMVVITHGHGDHYGGANYLAERYHPKIIASGADWDLMESGKLEFDIPSWGRPPKRGTAVEDGSKLTLGDTTLDVVLTPGHTMGTVSLAFDVYDQGRKHRALLWGGTSFNFGKQPNRMERLQAYIDATGRVRDLAARQNIDVFISNHAGFDLADVKLAKMQAGGPNPFVLGVDSTRRALTVMQECALATQVVWTGSESKKS